MRIVLDSNIMYSAAVSPEGTPAVVVDHLLSGDDVIILSKPMLKRFRKVLQRPYAKSRLTSSQRLRILMRYGWLATLYDPDESITGIADDAEDDIVLGTAVAGKADVIVTGDKGLLALHPFRGIAILTAWEFLDLIDT
jgi:hypothetical protein